MQNNYNNTEVTTMNTQQRGICPQTYEEYLETMTAYNFNPLKQDQWERRQIELHGYFKKSEVTTMNNLDEKDTAILAEREAAFNNHKGPRVGDFVRMLDYSIQRFSYDWGKDIQTTNGGSFYLDSNGLASFSGGLNPAIMKDTLEPIGA
jgi:hypothetical protein